MNKSINCAPIIGFVRYSQKRKFGNRDIERDVFESEYFEYRFNIFKEITLKSFQQQTDNNFVLLLLHSENMPTHYRERFIELEKANSFLYNVFIDDTQEAFDEAILGSVKFASFHKEVVITFRIDNDDAVQNNFIEQISTFLTHDLVGYVVSIPWFYIVKRVSDNVYLLQERYFPANAIGLAYVTKREQFKTVFNLGDHDLVNNQNAIIILPKATGGGLMSINGENEINSIDIRCAKALNNNELNLYLMERRIENLNLDCLRVFNQENTSSESLLKKTIRLLLPPVFLLFLQKVRNFSTKI